MSRQKLGVPCMTVTPWNPTSSTRAAGSWDSSAPAQTIDAPSMRGSRISTVWGSNVRDVRARKTSVSDRFSRRASCPMDHARLRWLVAIGFGSPVVPEVVSTYTRSRLGSSPRTAVNSVGVASRLSIAAAKSSTAMVGSPSVPTPFSVSNAEGRVAARIRSTKSAGALGWIGTYAAPAPMIESRATSAMGVRSVITATRSPGRTPCPARNAAPASRIARRSPYVVS